MNLEQFKELLKTGIFKDFIAGIDTLIKENPFLKQDIEQPEDDTEEDAPEKEEEKEDKKEDEKEEEKEVKKSSKKESNKENDDADDDADADEAEEDAEEKDTAEKALNFAAEAVNIAFDKEDRKRVAIAIRKYNIKSPALKWAGKIYKVAVAGYKAFGDEKQVAKVAPLLNVGGEILDDLANGVENAKFDIRNVTKLSSYITDHPQYRDDIAELYTQWQGDELKANTGKNSEFEPMEDELSVKDCLDQLMLNLERLKEKEPTRTQRDTDQTYQEKLDTHLENQFKSFRNLNYLYFQYNRLMIKQTAEINNAIRNNKFEIDYYDDQAFRMAQNGKDLFFSIGQFLKNSYNFTDVNAEKETKDYETVKNEYKEQCKESQKVVDNYIKAHGLDKFNFTKLLDKNDDLGKMINLDNYPQLKTLAENKGLISASDIINSPEMLLKNETTGKNGIDELEELINIAIQHERVDYEKKIQACELQADADHIKDLEEQKKLIENEYEEIQKEYDRIDAEMKQKSILPSTATDEYNTFNELYVEFESLKTSAISEGITQETIRETDKNILTQNLFESSDDHDYQDSIQTAVDKLEALNLTLSTNETEIKKLEDDNLEIKSQSKARLAEVKEIENRIAENNAKITDISNKLERKDDESLVSELDEDYLTSHGLSEKRIATYNLINKKNDTLTKLSNAVHTAIDPEGFKTALSNLVNAKNNLLSALKDAQPSLYESFKKEFGELTLFSYSDPYGKELSSQQAMFRDLSKLKNNVFAWNDKTGDYKKNFGRSSKISDQAKEAYASFASALNSMHRILGSVNGIKPLQKQLAEIQDSIRALYVGYEKDIQALAIANIQYKEQIDDKLAESKELEVLSKERLDAIAANDEKINNLKSQNAGIKKQYDYINKAKQLVESGQSLAKKKLNAHDEKLKADFERAKAKLQEKNNKLNKLEKDLSAQWALKKKEHLATLHKDIDESHVNKLQSYLESKSELIELKNSTLQLNSSLNNLNKESAKIYNAKINFVAKKSEVLEQRTAQLKTLQGQFTKQINEVIKRVERSKKLFGIGDSKYFKDVLLKIQNYKNNSDAFSNNDWNMSSEEWKDKSKDLLKSLETYIAKREDADGERKHTQLGQQRLDAVKALRAAIMERTKLISNFDKEEIALKEQVKNPDDILPVEIMLQSRIKAGAENRIYSDNELNKALISIAEKKSLEKAPEEELESLQDKIRMDEPEIKPIQINVPH